MTRMPDVPIFVTGRLWLHELPAEERSFLERDPGATGGALGMLTPEPHCGTDPDALVELGRAGLAGWRRLDASAGGGLGMVELRWVGLAIDGRHPPPSPAARSLTRRELEVLVTGPAPDVLAGVRIDGQARLDPLMAVARLAARLERVSTGVLVTSVDVQRGAVRRVGTSARPVSPGMVVFATGGPPAVDGIEAAVPADVVKGHMVVTEPALVAFGGTVDPLAPPLPDGRLAIGGTLDVGDRTPAVRPELVGSMVAGLGRWHPRLLDLRAERAWTCFRPHHPGGLPVIERVPGTDNAWFTSGHYRTGILAAPAAAAALVEWAATGARPASAEPFAAKRLAEVP